MKKLLYSILLLTFWACSEEFVEPVGDSSDALSRSGSVQRQKYVYISSEEALNLSNNAMTNFFKSETSQNRAKRRLEGTVSLYKSPVISRSSSSDTTFYIVNYQGGGFVLLAADKYIKHKVYAISNSDTFDETDINPAMQCYMNLACETLDYAERDTLVPNDAITYALDTTGLHMGDRREIAPGVWAYGVVTTTQDEKEPLTTTLWHQGDPFNLLCPNKAAAGCVAIAIGQICAYHKKPMSFRNFYIPWDEILANPSCENLSGVVNNNIAMFIRNIGDAVDMQYGINPYPSSNSSSGTTIQNALLGIRELGFTCDDIKDFTYLNVRRSISDGCPVYMRGTSSDGRGHAWVADGYRYLYNKVKYYREDNGAYCFSDGGYAYQTLRFNYGWSGDYRDTYFFFEDFTEEGDDKVEFRYNMKTICNIR